MMRDKVYGGWLRITASAAEFCSVSAGIPVVWVKTMDVAWIWDFKQGRPFTSWSGHVFLEVFVDGKWSLLNPGGNNLLPAIIRPRCGFCPVQRFAYDKGNDPKAMIMLSQGRRGSGKPPPISASWTWPFCRLTKSTARASAGKSLRDRQFARLPGVDGDGERIGPRRRQILQLLLTRPRSAGSDRQRHSDRNPQGQTDPLARNPEQPPQRLRRNLDALDFDPRQRHDDRLRGGLRTTSIHRQDGEVMAATRGRQRFSREMTVNLMDRPRNHRVQTGLGMSGTMCRLTALSEGRPMAF